MDKASLKLNPGNSPDLRIIRKALFWDTDIDKIDLGKKYKTIIGVFSNVEAI
ncbi:DUF6922 domain-containing protein [Mucilaginibacter sp.]